MKFLPILPVLILSFSSGFATFDPSNSSLAFSYKNTSDYQRSVAITKGIKIAANYRALPVNAKIFLTKVLGLNNKIREIEKQTGGGEGQIYQLVQEYPELKSQQDSMFAINCAFKPNQHFVNFLQSWKNKDENASVIMLDNIAKDTLAQWQQDYPEFFKVPSGICTLEKDEASKKMPKPYLYEKLSTMLPTDKKDIVMIANPSKIEGAKKAGLSVVASYAYKTGNGLKDTLSDLFVPTTWRINWMKQSLRKQGVAV